METTDDPPRAAVRRLEELEVAFCLACGRAQKRAALLALLRAGSWLGDGPAWFALAFLLPLLYGLDALSAVARMAIAGVACALLSSGLKRWISRPRPFVVHAAIAAGAAPLDRFSFPSGHTLHAVAFSVIAAAHYGELAWLLIPLTALIAASRVALGLHYPSDVLAGATVGGAIAWACLRLL